MIFHKTSAGQRIQKKYAKYQALFSMKKLKKERNYDCSLYQLWMDHFEWANSADDIDDIFLIFFFQTTGFDKETIYMKC